MSALGRAIPAKAGARLLPWYVWTLTFVSRTMGA